MAKEPIDCRLPECFTSILGLATSVLKADLVFFISEL
jgi:hypothetical protein